MYDADYEKRVETAIAKASAELAESYTLGTITVALERDRLGQARIASDYNSPYLLATCAECGARCVTAARQRREMASLALSLAREQCSKQGHVQDHAALLAQRRKDFPTPMPDLHIQWCNREENRDITGDPMRAHDATEVRVWHYDYLIVSVEKRDDSWFVAGSDDIVWTSLADTPYQTYSAAIDAPFARNDPDMYRAIQHAFNAG